MRTKILKKFMVILLVFLNQHENKIPIQIHTSKKRDTQKTFREYQTAEITIFYNVTLICFLVVNKNIFLLFYVCNMRTCTCIHATCEHEEQMTREATSEEIKSIKQMCNV